MNVWLTLKTIINNQIDNNWWYNTLIHCPNMTKLKNGVQWGWILSKGQCYLEKQWILTLTFHSLWCIILGITVHTLRIEANYIFIPELMHRYSWGILNIKTIWNLHFLCKNRKTLSEQNLTIFRDEINLVSRNISRISKAYLETWGQYSRI